MQIEKLYVNSVTHQGQMSTEFNPHPLKEGGCCNPFKTAVFAQ